MLRTASSFARHEKIVGTVRKLAELFCYRGAISDQRFRFATISVVGHDLVAGFEQTLRDRPPHRSDADKSELAVSQIDRNHFYFSLMDLDTTLFFEPAA